MLGRALNEGDRFVHIKDPLGAGGADLGAAGLRAAGMSAIVVDLERLGTGRTIDPECVTREARLRGAGLVVVGIDRADPEVVRAITATAPPLVFVGATSWNPAVADAVPFVFTLDARDAGGPADGVVELADRGRGAVRSGGTRCPSPGTSRRRPSRPSRPGPGGGRGNRRRYGPDLDRRPTAELARSRATRTTGGAECLLGRSDRQTPGRAGTARTRPPGSATGRWCSTVGDSVGAGDVAKGSPCCSPVAPAPARRWPPR